MTDHQRLQRSVLTGVEGRVLIWIARRLPASINPDHLSALGLASMLAAGVALAAAPVLPWAGWIVAAALAANWFGDSLDGTLARVRQQQRPRFGFYVDHVIDVLGTSCLFAGLAVSGIMSPVVAMATLAAYLLVCAESYLSTHVAGTFRMSFLGIGPTELRIVLAVGVVRAVGRPWIDLGGFGSFRLFDVGGVVSVAGMVGAFLACAAARTRALHLAEPRPPAVAALLRPARRVFQRGRGI